MRASVAYYPFLSNESAKDYTNFDPGIQSIGYEQLYPTGDDGSFRIPGLAGRGIVAVVADDDTRYAIAQGADKISGLRRRSPDEPRQLYLLITADVVNAVQEINAKADAKEITCDVRLRPLMPHKVRLLDPDGRPLAGVHADALTRTSFRGMRGGQPEQSSAIVDVLGLSEDKSRHVQFVHRDRNLAAIARLSVTDFPDDKPKDITLTPTAAITLRFVDGKGAAVPEAYAFVSMDANGEAERPGAIDWFMLPIGNTVKVDDRIRIERLPPNVKYTLRGYTTQNDLAATLQVGPLKPGEQLNLGELKLAPPATAADKPPSEPKKCQSRLAVKTNHRKPRPQLSRPIRSKERFWREAESWPRMVSLLRVQVLVLRVIRERPLKNVLLAETVTDGDGRFEAPYANEQPNSSFYIVAKRARSWPGLRSS